VRLKRVMNRVLRVMTTEMLRSEGKSREWGVKQRQG